MPKEAAFCQTLDEKCGLRTFISVAVLLGMSATRFWKQLD
jgi:hypothetical protein